MSRLPLGANYSFRHRMKLPTFSVEQATSLKAGSLQKLLRSAGRARVHSLLGCDDVPSGRHEKMEMRSRQNLVGECSELEAILMTAEPGINASTLARIKSICSSLEGDQRIREKANRLAKRADMYFSERRHLTYHGGAAAIMHEMRFGLLQAIRDRLADEPPAGVWEDHLLFDSGEQAER